MQSRNNISCIANVKVIEDQLAIKAKMRVLKGDEKQTIHLVSFWLGQTMEKREKKRKKGKKRKKRKEKSKKVCFVLVTCVFWVSSMILGFSMEINFSFFFLGFC